jgi:putative addiction module killer protein
MNPIEVIHYTSETDGDPFQKWVDDLADQKTKAKVLVRINRLAQGNPGDCKAVNSGVWELRIDWGPGYRVYYAQSGKEIVILLAGGSKKSQQSDIDSAVTRWTEWQQRSAKNEQSNKSDA